MIPLSEAYKIIEEEISKRESAVIPILEAAGCALDEDIMSPIDVPRFANSAMDGIAVRLTDLGGEGPWRLPIQKTIAAGHSPEIELKEGHASKIMTGAPLPAGADSVIRIEEVNFDSNYVTIKMKPPRGDFIRGAGDDIKKGELLYKKGALLDPVAIGILASIGRPEARVTPRPEIAVFSTGPELANPGQKLSEGQIYNSNNFVLKSLLQIDGHKISADIKTSADNTDALYKIIEESFNENDLVISTGGVSMGDYDLIPGVAKEIGGEILFHKVFVKPGKPVLLARIGKGYLLGLPGNPVSVVVGYHLYARRIIARLMGLEYRFRKGKALLGAELFLKGDRFCFIGARIEENKEGIIAYPSVRQQSGRLSSIIGINGFILAEGNKGKLSEGTEVDIEWMK